MRAMLLAAGLGIRMRPLTHDRPKPALSVLGRALALQNLNRMAANGIDNAVVNLHHCGEVLQALIGEGGSDGLPRVRYTHEAVILGTGGGLRNAAELLRGEGAFLVHNADFLSDIDFEALLETHRDGGHAATLALIPPRPGYGTVQVDARGRVISLAGAPATDPADVAGEFLFTGCHVLDDALLDRLPQGASNVVDLYRELAAEGRLGAYLHDGFWWEFGGPRAFLDGQRVLLGLEEAKRVRIADHDPVHDFAGGARASIGPGVDLDRDIAIHGACSIAMATRVGSGVRLEDSVLLEESWVGPDCRLERVIVGPHTELPAGFQAADAIVCADPAPDRPPLPGVERHDGFWIRPFGGKP